jgi:hypothetical protein
LSLDSVFANLAHANLAKMAHTTFAFYNPELTPRPTRTIKEKDLED